VGTDGRFDPDRILSVLLELDADIIALQEADMRFGDRRGLLDLAALHLRGNYSAVTDVGLQKSSHGFHGNVVLYREGTVRAVKRVKLPGLEPRGAIVVDLDLSSGNLRIIAAHLGLLKRSRSKQIEVILNAAETNSQRPVIVLGDMNEWRIGAKSSLKLFSPHFGPLHSAAASYPSRYPLLSLDRVMTSREIVVRDVLVHQSALAKVASDHLPIRATVELATQRELKPV
jgi:endonuclease/exonuclease/phosphatase family metal-dependent hydrolase